VHAVGFYTEYNISSRSNIYLYTPGKKKGYNYLNTNYCLEKLAKFKQMPYLKSCCLRKTSKTELSICQNMESGVVMNHNET